MEYGSATKFSYTQKDIQNIERIQKRFLSFAGCFKITQPSHNYTSVSEFLNSSNLELKRKILHVRFILLVLGMINASRLLNRLKFHIFRTEFRIKQVLGTSKTNYLCNDNIQRTMRLTNSDQILSL